MGNYSGCKYQLCYGNDTEVSPGGELKVLIVDDVGDVRVELGIGMGRT